jgi:hypothetical protein
MFVKGFEVVTVMVVKTSIFWDITPCSPFTVNRRFKEHVGSICLPPAFTLVSCRAYCSNLKMEATCSSKTPVDFQRTTRRYIPEDRTLDMGYVLLEIRSDFF